MRAYLSYLSIHPHSVIEFLAKRIWTKRTCLQIVFNEYSILFEFHGLRSSCVVHLLICEQNTLEAHTAELRIHEMLEKTSLKTESVENIFFAAI